VIDQSVPWTSTSSVSRALVACPGTLVLGYSHRPGDVASNRCLDLAVVVFSLDGIHGNVGNGVDGPVLAWAVARARPANPWFGLRRPGDDSNDTERGFTVECANLVRRHRIRLVRELAGRLRSGMSQAIVHSDFGRVGRKLLENRALGSGNLQVVLASNTCSLYNYEQVFERVRSRMAAVK